MQIKLLLIDFDGTLVDTRQANYRAYKSVLKEVGYELDEDQYLSEYFGMRSGEFMRLLGLTDSYQIDSLRRKKIEIYPEHFETVRLNQPLWDYAQEFRRNGGKVWIVSTGQTANIHNVMNYLNITNEVDGVMTGADVKNSKPSPECFLKAMTKEGATPQETLIFEDSVVGLRAAEDSGANFIKVKM